MLHCLVAWHLTFALALLRHTCCWSFGPTVAVVVAVAVAVAVTGAVEVAEFVAFAVIFERSAIAQLVTFVID